MKRIITQFILITNLVFFCSTLAFGQLTVELYFDGSGSPESAMQMHEEIKLHPDHLNSRISHIDNHFFGSFRSGSELTSSDFSKWLTKAGFHLACYFQTGVRENEAAYNEFIDCKRSRMAAAKVAGFNNCGIPHQLCDNEVVNLLPWGPGSLLTVWPDPPRNPDYSPYSTVSPWTNPWGSGTNYGCLRSGEQNTIWFKFTTTSTGQLEWSMSFPGTVSGSTMYMDWTIWPLTAATCTNLALNNSSAAPLRCNWNGSPSSPNGYTGMAANLATIPDSMEIDNFELSIPVVSGQEFLLIMDNWSGGTFNADFDFSLSPMSAGICGGPLPADYTILSGEVDDSNVKLVWFNLGPQQYDEFVIQRSRDGEEWKALKILSKQEFLNNPQFIDSDPHDGSSLYRIHKSALASEEQYSKAVEVTFHRSFPQLKIYPNPLKGQKLFLKADFEIDKIEILDVAGTSVYSERLNQAATNEVVIDLQLPDGLYFIHATDDQGSPFTDKLLIR